MNTFPDLPILSREEVQQSQQTRLSQSEKYGSLFYMGIFGLIGVSLLVGWFAWNVWTLRAVWTAIYDLNDTTRPIAERMEAANRLAKNPDVTPRQFWDLALNRDLPSLARYHLAEALDERALEPDSAAYALAVARSEGWPDWLRLALVRPLAYGAEHWAMPKAPLEELRAHPNLAIQAWAAYAQGVGRKDAEARASLKVMATQESPAGAVAQALENAAYALADSQERRNALDEATALGKKLPEVEELIQSKD